MCWYLDWGEWISHFLPGCTLMLLKVQWSLQTSLLAGIRQQIIVSSSRLICLMLKWLTDQSILVQSFSYMILFAFFFFLWEFWDINLLIDIFTQKTWRLPLCVLALYYLKEIDLWHSLFFFQCITLLYCGVSFSFLSRSIASWQIIISPYELSLKVGLITSQ